MTETKAKKRRRSGVASMGELLCYPRMSCSTAAGSKLKPRLASRSSSRRINSRGTYPEACCNQSTTAQALRGGSSVVGGSRSRWAGRVHQSRSQCRGRREATRHYGGDIKSGLRSRLFAKQRPDPFGHEAVAGTGDCGRIVMVAAVRRCRAGLRPVPVWGWVDILLFRRG